MFLINLTFTKALDEIDRHLAAHRAYLTEHYSAGSLLLGGRKVPRSGGIILPRQASREAVEALFEGDPLVQAQAARYEIVEFEPVMYAAELQGVL